MRSKPEIVDYLAARREFNAGDATSVATKSMKLHSQKTEPPDARPFGASDQEQE